MSKPISRLRRVATASIAIGVATVVLAGCSSASSNTGSNGKTSDVELVFGTYQGPISDALDEAYFDDYADETGVKITQVPADYARYIQTLESGKPDWNSLEADAYDLLNWSEADYIAKLDSDIPRADLLPEEIKDYSVSGYGQSFLVAYRESAFDSAPEDWADFWDVDKFPGKRGFPSYYINTAEAALMADGVAKDELYPLDLDRAFAKLDELKPNITVYESYAALAQGFQAGSVDIALIPSGRAAALAKEDPDIKLVWNQNIFSWAAYTITADAPNADAMQDVARFMADPKRQAVFAEGSGYAPVSKEAYQYISEETLEYLPGTEERLALAAIVDVEALRDQNTEYYERYTAWLAE
ncbi:extracellular solute-binding protein [Mycetocola sp. 2940]|uniref:extracellular solute-binding protein n=1 Tax=Mycetocola sp. 2940 TaxID=3156452 RepID=UPI00339158A0